MSLTRREFLGRSAAVAGVVALPGLSSSRVLGANEEIRVGVVGLGVRGGGTHIPRMAAQKGVRVAAICDPDQVRLGKTGAAIQKKYGYAAEPFADVRKMLQRKDLDVVCVATMQYWHALPTIWACQAGKHVYCEKPLSHFIWEGRQMVNAARRYNRLVQVGTQSRSTPSVYSSIEYLKAGHLGKIQYVTCFANKPRTSIGKRSEPLPIPDTLDYELWCGPARKEPIYRDRIQYDCSFTWNMGDGESCNQGVHEIDVARWILGETSLPRRVMSIGGRFVFNDAGDVPNTQIIYYDFPSAPVLYEVHNLRSEKDAPAASSLTPALSRKEREKAAKAPAPNFRGAAVDICVQCEGGYVMVRAGLVYDNRGQLITKLAGGPETHFENFIAAVRSGRREDLHADVLEGHRSTAICHAGNVSYRLGKPATAAELRAAVQETPLMAEMLQRFLEHVKKHDVNLDAPSVTLGPWLECDRQNECFRDNPAANRIVNGFYRPPFLVPTVNA
jgi:predicted dehydrogenase